MTTCPTEERARKRFNGKTNRPARITNLHRRATCSCRQHAGVCEGKLRQRSAGQANPLLAVHSPPARQLERSSAWRGFPGTAGRPHTTMVQRGEHTHVIPVSSTIHNTSQGRKKHEKLWMAVALDRPAHRHTCLCRPAEPERSSRLGQSGHHYRVPRPLWHA